MRQTTDVGVVADRDERLQIRLERHVAAERERAAVVRLMTFRCRRP